MFAVSSEFSCPKYLDEHCPSIFFCLQRPSVDAPYIETIANHLRFEFEPRAYGIIRFVLKLRPNMAWGISLCESLPDLFLDEHRPDVAVGRARERPRSC